MENLTKQKIFISVVFFLLIAYYFSHWIGCHLADTFFFSKLNLTLRIIFDIGNDQNIPQSLARILHNKVTQGSSDVINAYFAFWDIRFLLLLLSPFVVWGLLARLYFLIKEKTTRKRLDLWVFFLALFMPLLLLLHVIRYDTFALLLFLLPVSFLSLRGWFVFLNVRKHALWYAIALLLLSLWFSPLLGSVLMNFCTK